VVTSFAVPVGVPVAPFAPYFYSAQQFQPAAHISVIGGQELPSQPTVSATRPLLPPSTLSDAATSNFRTQLDSPIAAHCASCHGGPAPKGGFSLERVDQLQASDRLKAIRAVVSGRMPKGGKLSNDEVRTILDELTKLPD